MSAGDYLKAEHMDEPGKCRHWWRFRQHYGSENVYDCYDCHFARWRYMWWRFFRGH